MTRLAIFLMALAAPSFADQNIGGKTVDCYCTDTAGARVELGESICLQVGGRMFTAQCQMSLNVPMWRETSDGCMSSQLKISEPAPDTGLIDA
jgi:hypothetical protein